MDTLSHALWGKGLFGYRNYSWYAPLFGSMPDLLSFGLYFIFSIITKPDFQFGKPAIDEIPYWVFNLYSVCNYRFGCCLSSDVYGNDDVIANDDFYAI